jgi:hypothetical protein
MGLLKFLVFVQLVIALAFFSGKVTVDQLTDTAYQAKRAVTALCTRATEQTLSSFRK